MSDRGAHERKVVCAWGVEARRAAGAWEYGGLDAVGAWECSARCRYSRAQGRVACVFGSACAKNGACLRFNSESGSSLKSRKPSTCGFVNASCSDTEPARFKTQTCGFFWAARGRGATNRAWKRRKAPDARGWPNRVRRLGFGEVTPGAKRVPVVPCVRSQWAESSRQVEDSPIASGAERCGCAF